ncbi:hypothetical protein EJC47_15055 [Sphingomonas sp. TF3]|uniref:hypothetical protein n=1 Tax=Sphingomonas sp. TF3 TaxID=2495580 RepID=UPI000F86F963|nr:hypothetical protein [Sphingomonas sp. TF3]RUN75668.1 hypothetical protein EJC47_15055 [Sphingomonas sp. TF3]
MQPTTLLLALPLLIAAAPDAPVPCPTPAAPLPASLVAWQTGLSLAAATDAPTLAHTKVTIGKRVEVMLAPTDTVRYRLAPGKPPAPGSMGGLLGVTVRRAGTYRVALGTGAWIDLVRARTSLTSVAHEHGPACSGIRKIVDFKLRPGRYVLQISGSKEAATPVLVTALP